MKKFLLLTLTIVVACATAMAADVDLATAQRSAQSFMSKQVANGRLKAAATSNLKLAKAEASVFNPKAVDYYIFNADKSYVVVAGDDQAPEILMYGEEGTIDLNNIPPAMQWLLNKYKYQIDGLKAGTMKANGFVPKTATAVAPMVTANWDQSAPYNNQCPTSGSRRAVTGCPATSLAMCYYKWKWPTTFPACAAINGNTSGGFSADALPERAADWANIIDEYTGPTNTSYNTTQANAVAWLMRYAGQTIPDYMYDTSASGAEDPEIYQGVLNMGYTDAQYLLLTELVQSGWSYTNSAQKYTDAQWNNYMMTELQAGRPIEYLAYDISGYSVSGHAFNVFGCNTSGQYYVNWGWSGSSNGYCTLHNFTTAVGATGQSGSYVFKYGEAMIIGIEPPAGALGPSLSVDVSSVNLQPGKTKTISLTGSNITSDVALTLNDPNNAFTLSVDGISQTLNAAPKSSGTITIPASRISDTNPVNITLGAKSNINGDVNGSLSIASQGADTKTISLKATNILNGKATDNYFNIANYSTIDDVHWQSNYVTGLTNIYKYTEYPDEGVAWFTMPVYGAWTAYYYNSNPLPWIKSSKNDVSNYFGTATWEASGYNLGSSAYFSSGNSKYFGPTNNPQTSQTISFYVTNILNFSILGVNNSNATTGTGSRIREYPTTLKVYECTEDNGTVTATTQIADWSSAENNYEIALSFTNDLDPEKIYMFEFGVMRAKLYEVGFSTPLDVPKTPINVAADPSTTTADITWTPGENNEFWNLRWRPYVEDEIKFYDNFENGLNNWTIYTDGTAPQTDGWTTTNTSSALEFDAVSGSYAASSWSWSSSIYNADNWLITPQVTFGNELRFWVRTNKGYPDSYEVLLSTTGNAESNFNVTLQEMAEAPAVSDWTEVSIDLSDYVGLSGYIAIHHVSRDCNYLLIDDFGIYNSNTAAWNYVNGVTSPYTIEGLTPETTYEVQVQGGNAEYGTSSWTSSTIFTTLNGVGVPTIVSADPGSTTADITWTPGENNDGWNLRYHPYVEPTMETILWDLPNDDDILDQQLEGWSMYDADEDGNGWELYYTDDDQTDLCFGSASRDLSQSTYPAISPDNWLFTPTVTLGGTLKFKASLANASYPDKMGVYVMPDGDEYYYKLQDITPTSTDFTEYEFDLSDYEGTGQIAFRHYESDGKLVIFLDDIEITYPSAQEGEWIYINDVESPYTITGLTPETTYEVQVQGTQDNYQSAWTPSTIFTTLSIVDATLANIESTGKKGETYTISDELVAVYANPEMGILWCKDQGTSDQPISSLLPTYIKDGQIDYMKDFAGEQKRDWDQSNWVALKFPEATSTNTNSFLTAAVGKKIAAGTITGRYTDNENYTIEVLPNENNEYFTLSGDGGYTMNVYCTANFLETNLNLTAESQGAPGLYHGQPAFFFFMNPKIQEVCKITYAEWDGSKFVVPTEDDSQIPGAFNVDFSRNGQTPTLQVGKVYQFVATVVNRPRMSGMLKADPSSNIVVMPLNLTGGTENDVPTGINTVGKDNREVVAVEYVNSLGLTSKKPFHGVNIVVTRYSDGTKTTVKKIFK